MRKSTRKGGCFVSLTLTLCGFMDTGLAQTVPAQIPIMYDRHCTQGSGICYGFAAGNATLDATNAAPWSSFIVGAQLNAILSRGTEQGVWGLAIESNVGPEATGAAIGAEVSAINRSPANGYPKRVLFLTYKNRWDVEYATPPREAMNEDASFIFLESQPGTGASSGIVFDRHSLYPDRKHPNPTVLDFERVPLEVFKTWALVRYPDGYCEYYVGEGGKEVRKCDLPAQ